MSDVEDSDIELEPFESSCSEDDEDEEVSEVTTTEIPPVLRKPSKLQAPLTWKVLQRCGTLVEAKEYVKTEKPLMTYCRRRRNEIREGFKVYYRCKQRRTEQKCECILTLNELNGVSQVDVCEARQHTCNPKTLNTKMQLKRLCFHNIFVDRLRLTQFARTSKKKYCFV